MSNKYAGTKTEENLMAACVGESQARNKYTYFASIAKKEGYEQIAALFLDTANNEKEHAKLWFKELDLIHGTEENLLAAAEGRSPEQCAALAAAEGACAVTAYDALSGLKTLDVLEARIASGWETM